MERSGNYFTFRLFINKLNSVLKKAISRVTASFAVNETDTEINVNIDGKQTEFN